MGKGCKKAGHNYPIAKLAGAKRLGVAQLPIKSELHRSSQKCNQE
jgi:hypothetical protein